MRTIRDRLPLIAIAIATLLTAASCGSARSEAEFEALYAGQSSNVAGGQLDSTDPTSGQATSDSGASGGDSPQAATAQESSSSPSGGQTADDAGAATGAPQEAADPAAPNAAPGAPIRIGSVGTFGGVVGAAVGGGTKSVQAWVKFVNAQGGVGGHPIELFTADDGGDPALHRSLVQEMVEEKGVVAFVHNPAPLSGQAAVSYLESNNIPVIGSEGGSPWVNSSPAFFPQMASDAKISESFGNAVGAVAKEQGHTRVAIITCAEIQGCDTSAASGPFEAAGLEVVYRTRASLGQPDYTSQCLNARNAGAQILFLGMDGQSVKRIAENCNNVGYKPVFGEVAQAVVSAHASNPLLDGMLTPQNVAPWFQTDIPAVAEFVQAMQAFAPGVDLNGSTMQGWTSAEMFEAAVLASPGDPTTPEGIKAGLYALNGNDLGGLTYPLSFTEGAANNAGSSKGCWWDVRIQGGKFVSPNGGKRTCP